MRMLLSVIAAITLAQPVFGQPAHVRFGNLHAHTSYSDGLGEPRDAFTMACDAGLDFFAITEHNHAAGDGKGERKDNRMIATIPTLYRGSPDALVETANALDRPGNCVTIYGQEFSTISTGNHVNIFDIAEIVPVENGRFNLLLEWLRTHPDQGGSPPVVQFNHPRSGKKSLKDYGRDDFADGEVAWLQQMPPHVSLIEVFNAPALQDGTVQRTHDRSALYRRYLNLGFHLAPSVGHDNHFRNWGVSTDARVAVITPDFTRRGVLEALRRRHAYATEDKNLRVVFRSGAALQGDIASPPPVGSELPLTVQIVDGDEEEQDAVYRVDVFKDIAGGAVANSPVESFEFSGNQAAAVPLEGITYDEPGQYVFLRITQQVNEMAADDATLHDEEHPIEDVVWTAPIWFEPGHFHDHETVSPSVRIVALIPSPLGDDAQAESITFKNTGTSAVDMTNWQVRDFAGNVWTLASLGTLGAGEQRAMLRAGQAMALNNNGDQVELVAPGGTVVQLVSYGDTAEGATVVPEGT
jgi:hypothetical protein